MNNKDFQALVKELEGVEVQLPLHQKALRNRLITMQPYQSTSSAARGAKFVHMRMLLSSNKILSVVIGLMVAGALTLGVIALISDRSEAPAKKLIAEATKKVKQMAPAKVTAASKDSPATDNHIKDARESEKLRLATPSEVDNLVGGEFKQERSIAKVQVSNNASAEPTVVITLDENQPLLVLEVGDAVKRDNPGQNKKDKDRAQNDKALKHKDLKHGVLGEILSFGE